MGACDECVWKHLFLQVLAKAKEKVGMNEEENGRYW